MSTRRTLILTALLSATLAGAAGVPLVNGAQKVARCAPKGRVLAANSTAILWRTGSERRGYETYACVWRTGRTRSFGGYDNEGGDGTYAFRLAGRYLAYDELACGTEGCIGGLTVRDLVRRRDVKSIPIEPATGLLGSMVLKSNGSVAYIRYAGEEGAKLRKVDSDGTTLLDTIPDQQDATSLALAGSTLYWTHAGQPRSAPLR